MEHYGWHDSALGTGADDLNLLGGPLVEVDDQTLQVTHAPASRAPRRALNVGTGGWS